jgi:hypothetical protein
MYQFKSKQISFTDFQPPIGMKLSPNNRRVKKAETIPWYEIEKRYGKLFTNRKGNVAKPLQLALGACIIQAEYGYSDKEIALQIQSCKTQMWNWTYHDKIKRNNFPLPCHVCFAVEPTKNWKRFF